MKKRNDTSRGERGGSLWKSRIIGGIVAAVIVLVMFWFMLPPINLTSPVFWRFAVLSLIVFLVCMSVGELRGSAASAGTSEVEWGALAGFAVILLAGLGSGLILNRYLTHKKITKLK